MKNMLVGLWKDERGQDLVEYGLLLVLIALVSITLIKGIGGTLSNIFSNANAALEGAAPSGGGGGN